MNRMLVAFSVLVVVGVPSIFTAGVVVALCFAADANPADALKTVLGSVGDWVSGLGALSASVIAIHLADKQRRDGLPKIEVSQDADPELVYIKVASAGDRSVLVTGILVHSRKRRSRTRLLHRDFFPKRLEFGDFIDIELDGTQLRGASNVLCGEDDMCDLSDLEILVETSLGTHSFAASDELIGLLEGTLSIRYSYD